MSKSQRARNRVHKAALSITDEGIHFDPRPPLDIEITRNKEKRRWEWVCPICPDAANHFLCHGHSYRSFEDAQDDAFNHESDHFFEKYPFTATGMEP